MECVIGCVDWNGWLGHWVGYGMLAPPTSNPFLASNIHHGSSSRSPFEVWLST